MEKKTALYDCHEECGGKMVPFAGYLLPVQYGSGVIAEHMAVRTKAGLFDVSHMGEVRCKGENALRYLNYILTNDFTKMRDGQVRYSPMCNEAGGVVDDLLVYKYCDGDYLIVVNAANREKDVAWMEEHRMEGMELTDVSDGISQIALQGPKAHAVLCRLAEEEKLPVKYYSFVPEIMIADIPCLVSKTGYTGDDGYELYVENAYAPALWKLLLEAGEEDGLIPCGLGARDTLRLEAAMPLYGHEMDDTVTPLEAGLGFAVKMQKEGFIGKEGMEARLPLTRKRVGLKVTGRGIVREHEKVTVGEIEAGYTTSGTHCPYIGCPVAMALLELAYTETGTAVEVEVRGRKIAAEVTELPFFKKSY